MVMELERGEGGTITRCLMEAVVTRETRWLHWRELKDRSRWLHGWV